MHPTFVRHLILPLHERLLGRGTTARLRDLMRTDGAPAAALRELQRGRLRALLAHAQARCPAYRRRIQEAGVNPATADVESLQYIRPVDKDELRAATPDIARRGRRAADRGPFCDPSVPGGLHRYTTGGSTGSPLVFYVDRRRQAADQAARARTRRWFCVEPGEREYYLWGAPAELRAQDRLRRIRDRLFNHRLANAFDMTPRRMDEVLDELWRFNPAHLFGYPSSLARLARHAMQRDATPRLPNLKAVFVTGEVLTPEFRDMIRDCFGVPVADGFGSREAGFIAHECPAGRLHVAMENVIVEILDDADRPVRAGDAGEIVVTNLDAYGMPFIRYRTGDAARRDTRPCPCGRSHDVLTDLAGRRGDAIRLPDGGAAHALSAMYPLRECAALSEYRVIQRADLSLDVTLVPASGFSETDRARLLEAMRSQFHGRLAVRMHLAAALAPDASGKHRAVRSEAW